MNTDLSRVLKAIAGIVVLFILVTVVFGWWRDYRAATPEGQQPGSAPTTQTPDSTATPGGDATAPASAKAKTIVVLIDGLNLRETPDTGGKRIRSLKKGDRVTLVKTQESWHQVRTADKKVGWITDNPQYSKIED